MKTLSLKAMETLEAGGQNRSCMIAGGIATIAFATGSWNLVYGIIAGAAYYGCFN